jgi:nitrite reductase (NO-forming)
MKRWWTPIAAVVIVILMATAAVSVPLTLASDDAAPATNAGETLSVELKDVSISPSILSIPKNKSFTLQVRNTGAMAHDLRLDNGVATPMLKPGEEHQLTVPASTENMSGWCTVAGHKAAGMTMQLRVHDHGEHAEPPAGQSKAQTAGTGENATIDFAAKPTAGWHSSNPALAPAATQREHRITLRATEKVMEVAPGVRQEMWTFEDQVPGPALRGKVGDTFIITLVNNGGMGHSIDFHAGKAAPNRVMRTLQPGESLEYRFTANHAGVFMYHCGTTPALHHIGNGMFGAIVIDPPDLAPVDREFLIVQSEIYTGPQDKAGDLTKMLNKTPDAVVFNGYANQYQHEPIEVERAERIRVFVLDAGPSLASSFHVVGTVFDTMYHEGSYSLRPGNSGGAQALGLQAAQGGFVEFSLDEDGSYPFVTHNFADAAKGALGSFQVGHAHEHAEGMSH